MMHPIGNGRRKPVNALFVLLLALSFAACAADVARNGAGDVSPPATAETGIAATDIPEGRELLGASRKVEPGARMDAVRILLGLDKLRATRNGDNVTLVLRAGPQTRVADFECTSGGEQGFFACLQRCIAVQNEGECGCFSVEGGCGCSC